MSVMIQNVEASAKVAKSCSSDSTSRCSSRIPPTLQAVILASSRGNEVHKPPPDKVASKVFRNDDNNNNLKNKRQGVNYLTPMMVRPLSFCRQSHNRSAIIGEISASTGQKEEEKCKPSSKFLFRRSSSSCSTTSMCSSTDLSESDSIELSPPTMSPAVRKSSQHSSPQKNKRKNLMTPSLSPQAYLDAMIQSRGYSAECYKTLDTAYYNKPTALQTASYHIYLIDVVKKGDIQTFGSIIGSGVSLNPCNVHGESVVHMLCRRGYVNFLRLLLKQEEQQPNSLSVLQVSDDYGRTPLHDACWTAKPNFEIVELILQHDRTLLHLMDCRGALPLSYVRKENWAEWLEFFATKKDLLWPKLKKQSSADSPTTAVDLSSSPPLTHLPPNSRPLADPANALSPVLAGLVSNGHTSPDEAKLLQSRNNHSRSSGDLMETVSEDSDDSSVSNESFYDSDKDDDSSVCSSDSEVDITCDFSESQWGHEDTTEYYDALDKSVSTFLSEYGTGRKSPSTLMGRLQNPTMTKSDSLLTMINERCHI